MVVWIVVALLILIASGIEQPSDHQAREFWCWCGSFKLSDSVLIALIGGTTVNVIGLFLVVANYLFPRRKGSD